MMIETSTNFFDNVKEVGRPALTPRGAAYLRLADFRDLWAGLSSADRAYFAEDLRDLLVDAVMEASAPTA